MQIVGNKYTKLYKNPIPERILLLFIGLLIGTLFLSFDTSAQARLPQQDGKVDLLTQANVKIYRSDVSYGDQVGTNAGAGDVNKDGLADVILGASNADYNGRKDSGSAYVIYGKSTNSTVDLNEIGKPGNSDGFRIDGAKNYDLTGSSVAGAGDVNKDGRTDVIVGAPGYIYLMYPGSAYVIYGKSTNSTVDLNEIGKPGNSDGFRIDSASFRGYTGYSVSGAGDVNKDGRADVIVGAPLTERYRYGTYEGSAYVIFGKSTNSTVDLRKIGKPGNREGFRIVGAYLNDWTGWSVSGAGDVNKDGRADVIVGTFRGDTKLSRSASAYVIFGKSTNSTVDLRKIGKPGNREGFRINSNSSGDWAGWSVAGTGDINDDNRADVIVGASYADNNGRKDSGSAYVIYGKSTNSTVDLDNIGKSGNTEGFTEGFRIDGASTDDRAGLSVAGTGDINDDNRADVIVGASYADNNGRKDSGSAYVIYGKSTNSTVDLNEIGKPGNSDGFRIDGAGTDDHADSFTGAGDFNDDSHADVIGNGNNGNNGTAYIVYGFGTPQLSYGTDPVYEKAGKQAKPITPTTFRHTGVTHFSVDPSLPEGFTIDQSTGIISGIPKSSSPLTTYTVTMTDLTCKLPECSITAIFTLEIGSPGLDLLTQANVTLQGAAAGDEAGFSVASAGDLNNDKIDEVIVGAPNADRPGKSSDDNTGAAYVIFGQPALTTVDLSKLGSFGYDKGFVIQGVNPGDQAGWSVAGGADLNGDTIPDLVVGAPNSARPGGGDLAGSTYVVFGKTSYDTVNLAQVGKGPPSDDPGFRIIGAQEVDSSGWSVATTPDLSKDGKSEVIIGVPFASASSARPLSGSTYVVFGKGVGTVDLRKLGNFGIKVSGANPSDQSGRSVAGGDINADGIGDVAIGAPLAGNNGREQSGSAYLVYGQEGINTPVDLRTFSKRNNGRGYEIDGAVEDDWVGFAVALSKDMGSDGLGELVIGAPMASPLDRTTAGATYTVFGKPKSNKMPPIDLGRLGNDGYAIYGAASDDRTGWSVADAGDQNNDNHQDVAVGAPYTDYRNRQDSGSAYIVYGKSSNELVDLTQAASIFRIDGAISNDLAGWSLAFAGDFNKDTHPDLITGSINSNANVDGNIRDESGSAYLLFGSFKLNPLAPTFERSSVKYKTANCDHSPLQQTVVKINAFNQRFKAHPSGNLKNHIIALTHKLFSGLKGCGK